ncbi:MAG: HPF/RaiA family ribosome-associated protein [Oligoflexia bacterium]|nr:HPF/RaiA family ribosome-associated protein [Oligoflexia bacterium]
MRLEISFRNTDPTDKEKAALTARVERKIRKITRFLRDPIEVSLVLYAQKLGYRGELQVAGAGDDTFVAGVEAEDPIAAIDGLIHTVERAARRRHDRRLSKEKRLVRPVEGSFTGASPAPSAGAGFDLDEDEDIDLETEEISKALHELPA